jgi:hypothetical protein
MNLTRQGSLQLYWVQGFRGSRFWFGSSEVLLASACEPELRNPEPER